MDNDIVGKVIERACTSKPASFFEKSVGHLLVASRVQGNNALLTLLRPLDGLFIHSLVGDGLLQSIRDKCIRRLGLSGVNNLNFEHAPVFIRHTVLMLVEDHQSDWELGALGGDYFCVRADEFVALKQQGAISGQTFPLRPAGNNFIMIHSLSCQFITNCHDGSLGLRATPRRPTSRSDMCGRRNVRRGPVKGRTVTGLRGKVETQKKQKKKKKNKYPASCLKCRYT
ncbi:hypothetical protein DFH09DRAFT_1483357 [Mycena vulgaris]|nr:hypothetical protein DFH09DRAFT_1483357 [Mycena vulgaris]